MVTVRSITKDDGKCDGCTDAAAVVVIEIGNHVERLCDVCVDDLGIALDEFDAEHDTVKYLRRNFHVCDVTV